MKSTCFMIIFNPFEVEGTFIYKREFSSRTEAAEFSNLILGRNKQIVVVRKSR
jgi:hypothetical protein